MTAGSSAHEIVLFGMIGYGGRKLAVPVTYSMAVQYVCEMVLCNGRIWCVIDPVSDESKCIRATAQRLDIAEVER
jgi:hypothetical protein